MADSYKLKDDNYIDSTSVVNGHTPLPEEITNMKNDINARVRGYRKSWGTSFEFPLNIGEIALVIINATNMLLVWHGGNEPSSGYNVNIVYNLNTAMNPTVVGGNNKATVNTVGNATFKAFIF
ncbi:MAG: hypothetical protein K6B70_01320 [Clostridia bacterium]|nr:hypothetical protein [Clostridia bacterium]